MAEVAKADKVLLDDGARRLPFSAFALGVKELYATLSCTTRQSKLEKRAAHIKPGSDKFANEIIKCHSRTHNSQSCPVERAVAAAEGGIGDAVAPGLAHEGCADEARRLSCREAEEDLADEVVHQLRRRHDAGLAASSGSTVTGLADGDGRRLHVARPGWQ
ncbi:unnamed protein product [Miscanthus lutarioriparius]|uniref:Uncharacterized protein n=1 Tax=Miscanthus lutarioriparius TaxID=422564 RepID=A0A811RYI5_9POAL|nr:unnamed protein product [Miscanthus lutarioriparius]